MKPLFDVDKVVNARMQVLIQALINTLIYVGERCVKEARETGNYQDQTGNLRNSIDYVVLYNGVVKGKSIGNSQSKKTLEQLIPKYRQGLVLLVVTGMNYAVYVEATGRNVLTSAELLAERLIPQILTQLGLKK